MEQKILSQFENSTLLTEYTKNYKTSSKVQSEAELENELIKTLEKIGYEYRPDIKNEQDLIENLRVQLEKLNAQRIRGFKFTDKEWDEFLSKHIAGSQNWGIDNKTEKIQGDKYQVTWYKSDGSFENIRFIDKNQPDNNFLQVINQYRDEEGRRRYDVTILMNGLPMVQIELKKRGVALKEAFFQVDNYKNNSYSSSYKLFEFIQIFVISNGTSTKYYSNTTQQSKWDKKKASESFLFTSYWTDSKNQRIEELMDFATSFLHPRVIKRIISKYCVFDTQKKLKVLRPYQIEAIEKIRDRVEISINHKLHKEEAGGYIWHTTGSGKTLTSFKASQLVLEIPSVQKVLFIVDRKDLDHQTCQEYEKYEKGSVDSTKNTSELEEKLLETTKRKKIIVTTIQKLSRLLKGNLKSKSFQERFVIIIDECHRSQTGIMHETILKKFKNANVFGFTGTPILENKDKSINTDVIFGSELHSYKICDAITDENVLGFHYEYLGDRKYQDSKDLAVLEAKRKKAVEWILKDFDFKTNNSTYNGMLATDCIDSAIKYHKLFAQLQEKREKKLRVAIIYSSGSDNSEAGQKVIDSYEIDPLETKNLPQSAKEYLESSAKEYEKMFDSQVDLKQGLSNYHSEISKKMKSRELDILIVVNMFLTGFDAPTLNTLWVDKNLKEHGLIQAFSRTNRIYNDSKPFGNIVSFVDLEENLQNALKKFAGDAKIVTAPSFDECYKQYTDCWKKRLVKNFPLEKNNMGIVGENDEVEFCKTFGEFIKLENILKHYSKFQESEKLNERDVQNYKSKYLDIRDKIKKNRDKQETESQNQQSTNTKYEEITFEMEILKTQIINVDYILKLLTTIKTADDPRRLEQEKENLLRVVSADSSWREIYDLFKEYLEYQIYQKINWLDYMKTKKIEELNNIVNEERLNLEKTKKFVDDIFRSDEDFISWEGTKLREMMPPMGFIKKTKIEMEEQNRKKASVREKIERLFRRFKNRGI